MTNDLNKLSSEELFELARRRQQEEQEQAQRTAMAERVAELKKARTLIIGKHNEALAATDKAIGELQAKRGKLLDDYEAALAPIDRELRELTAKSETTADKSVAEQRPQVPAPAPAPTAPKPEVKPEAKPEPEPARPESPVTTVASADDLFIHVRELMLGRTYISESLLKEQLRSRSVTVQNLHKLLEQLVKDGRLASKGGGNYALGRKA